MVEAGRGLDTDQHAATMTKGSVGVVDGKGRLTLSFLKMVSGAGLLDFVQVWTILSWSPEHAFFKDSGRA